ncbi:MAG: hypothetical protein K1X67_26035 [Fimbriimonadaceae bacterium]|nr:hypothetical protein [Fimbriimonadaceae bacterium]
MKRRASTTIAAGMVLLLVFGCSSATGNKPATSGSSHNKVNLEVDIWSNKDVPSIATNGLSKYSPGIIGSDSGDCWGYGDNDSTRTLRVTDQSGKVVYEAPLGVGRIKTYPVVGPMGDYGAYGERVARLACAVYQSFDGGASDELGNYAATLDGKAVKAVYSPKAPDDPKPLLTVSLNQEQDFDLGMYREPEVRKIAKSISLSPYDLRGAIEDLSRMHDPVLLSGCAIDYIYDSGPLEKNTPAILELFRSMSVRDEVPRDGEVANLVNSARLYCGEIRSRSDGNSNVTAVRGLAEPPGLDRDMDEKWNSCANGDDQACSDLVYHAIAGSAYYAFGAWCSGRAPCRQSDWVASSQYNRTKDHPAGPSGR